MNNFAEKPSLYPSLELLMKVFDFTEDDLISNQQGFLTRSQMRQIQEKGTSYQYNEMLSCSLLGLLGLCCWLPASFNSIMEAEPTNSLNIFLAIGVLPVILLWLIIILYLGWVSQRTRNAKKKKSELQFICGMMVLSRETRYKAEVGDETFHLDSKQFFALENGRQYCIYFYRHPAHNFLLSIEPA